MSRPELHFEEAIFDEASGHGRLEIPLPPQVAWGIALVSLAVLLIVLGRIIFLNLNQGPFYQARAAVNVNKEILQPASRGLIVDRFGEPLVKNTPTFSVSLNLPDFFRSFRRASDDLERIAGSLGAPVESLRELIARADLENLTKVIIAPDASLEQAIKLRGLSIEALQVRNDYKRYYPNGPVFAHVLGYTGVAERGDEIVGKVGLEKVYDKQLRGRAGRRIIYRDVSGEVLSEKAVEDVQAGYQLNTTIDAPLQRFFYQRLENNLRALGRNSGVGLALNPQTGEILALISFPSFDNNRPADYLNSKDKALFNRAVTGVYSPGSTLKPFIALAALKEKIVAPADEFYSAGYLEIPNPFFPSRPSRFLDWRAHGYVNLFSALAQSSNVYFYIVGGGFKNFKGLGVERLQEYWRRFALGEPTGIDLTAEARGFFYGPADKQQRTGEIWRVGDTYNVSIGQGDLAMTPLRLLTATGFLGSNGKTYRPFIGESFVDERGNRQRLNQPEVTADYSDLYSLIYEVKKGLRSAVSNPQGTAHSLADLPVAVAGKTGSAQIAGNSRTNAFFVGYAPADDPQIAVLVLVENAREGSLNALPVAKEVLWWYYYNRINK